MEQIQRDTLRALVKFARDNWGEFADLFTDYEGKDGAPCDIVTSGELSTTLDELESLAIYAQ